MSQRAGFPEFDGRLMDGLLFCRRVYRYFEGVRRGPDGKSLLRHRSDTKLKKLVEELLPLAAFIQRRYSAGVLMSVRWLAGSQRFDAEIRQRGSAVESGLYARKVLIEITSAVHKNDYDNRRLIDAKQVSFGPRSISRNAKGEVTSTPYVWHNYEFLDSMVSMIRHAVGKKTAKLYPQDTVLIVNCTFERPVLPDEWEACVLQINQTIDIRPFAEVFLLDVSGRFTASIYPPPTNA